MNNSIKPDKEHLPYTTKISMAVLALIIWAFVIFVVFGIYQKVFAASYLGPTGITFTDGTAPNTFQDVGMTGGTNHSIWGFRNGTVFGAVSYTGSQYVWDNFQATDEDIPDGLYCFDDDAVYDVCTDGQFTILNGTIEEDLTATRIIRTDPENDQLIATSSLPYMLEVDYFLSDFDYENYGDDDFLRVRYKNNTTSIVFSGIHAISAVTDPWEVTYEQEIVGFGYQTFSTTTSPQEVGRYTLEAQIVRPSFSLLGFTFGETIMARFTDSFIVGTSTQYDRIKDQTNSELEALGLSGVESVCADDLSLLNPISFAICLFAFDGEGLAQVFINAREGFMTRVPFGYVNRTYDILTSSATSSLPTISYTFSEGPLQGANVAFNPWQYMYVDGAPLKDGIVSNNGGENIWEIVEPFYEIVVYLTLALLVFRKLTGVHLQNSHKPE